ncbi:DUF222 domain-containing protein [Paenarthrobacter sp. NyZ202]|uniref:HNH endonuclease signature motif containing protein n=1 Tax=Paenarthrobacter sp. NyZ202 TaxID=3402689 RepID=UPI003CEBF298
MGINGQVAALRAGTSALAVPTPAPAGGEVEEALEEGAAALEALRSAAGSAARLFDVQEAADFAGRVEDLARTIGYLQIVAAQAVERTREAAKHTPHTTTAFAAETAGAGAGAGAGPGWRTGWTETDNTLDTGNAPDTPGTPGQDPADQTGTIPAPKEARTTAGEGSTSAELAWQNRSVLDDGYRNTAEFLRARLRIEIREARRRLALAHDTLPGTTITGQPTPARHEELAHALATAQIPSRSATIITTALDQVRHAAHPQTLAAMEHALTTTATESDPDFVAKIARRWSDRIDQDGPEPTEEALRHHQGAFIRKPRHGLHHIEIFATAEQYETLATAMNAATNPRLTPTTPNNSTTTPNAPGPTPETPGTTPNNSTTTPNAPSPACLNAQGTGTYPAADTTADTTPSAVAKTYPAASKPAPATAAVIEHKSLAHPGTPPHRTPTSHKQPTSPTPGPAPELDRRSRAQKLLDGLVAACALALKTTRLPANGGLKPQLTITIDAHELFNQLHPTTKPTQKHLSTGTATFTGPLHPNTIRKIACDADILPVLLGTDGQILDIGRTTRIFPPHIRKAITARDQGCAFPDCTIPAPWCEAHHITYWSHGGPTSTNNGTLLCSHHHHLIHKEQWKITTRNGTPWFTPPPHIDPQQTPRRNHHHTKHATHDSPTNHTPTNRTRQVPVKEIPTTNSGPPPERGRPD